MFMRFVEEIHLLIVNTLPISRGGVFTRFDDGRGHHSLLDYALIGAESSDLVNSFVIDENARISCGSDHALLLCSLRFDHRPRINWRFHNVFNYNITDGTKYEAYMAALDIALSSCGMSTFTSLSSDQMLMHITNCIHEAAKAAKAAIGFKVFKRKKGRKLPQDTIKMIKEKNELAKKIAETSRSQGYIFFPLRPSLILDNVS